MTTHTTIRSPSAILIGLGFFCVTGYVLLEDVFKHQAPVTTSHIMTVAVLIGTVYFGHKFSPLLRQFNPWCLGCAILFMAGTAYCVISSAGRNADTMAYKAVVANNANAERDRARLDLAEAKDRYNTAFRAETSECGTGKGTKCDGRRLTTQQARADLEKAEGAWRAQAPEQVANGDMAAAAQMIARLPGVTMDAQTIEASLLLGFPFLRALFCEIAAIVAFGFGLGHGRRKVAVAVAKLPVAEEATVSMVATTPPVSREPVTANVVRLPVRLPQPARGERPAKLKRVWPSDIQHVVDAIEKLGGIAESNDQLAEAMGCHKSESSKRLYNCVQAGAVTATRRGRRLEIRAA